MAEPTEILDVVVIGAGFCGLGAGASFVTAGVKNFAILEQGDGVGHFWSRTYDRIHLHSPWHDLPRDGGAIAHYPMYKSRDELLRYFREYAAHYNLGEHLRFGQHVKRISRDRSGPAEWSIETDDTVLGARYVAIATAANRTPIIPEIAGRERYQGRLLHSAHYRNAQAFAGQKVLVIGSGNSAAEISVDLLEGGAASVQMWVRGARHFIPLRSMTRLFRLFRRLGLFTPGKMDQSHEITSGTEEFDKLVRQRDFLPRFFSADLSRFGIRKPERGPMVETYATRRIPVFDQGAIPRIRRMEIGVIDGNVRPIIELTAGGVRFGRTGEERFDAIVLATGFAPSLGQFLAHPEMLSSAPGPRLNFPVTDGRSRSTVHPTAFFPGFDLSVNGGHSLGRWGWEAGERIAAELHGGAQR